MKMFRSTATGAVIALAENSPLLAAYEASPAYKPVRASAQVSEDPTDEASSEEGVQPNDSLGNPAGRGGSHRSPGKSGRS
jgi:hypothetical protein